MTGVTVQSWRDECPSRPLDARLRGHDGRVCWRPGVESSRHSGPSRNPGVGKSSSIAPATAQTESTSGVLPSFRRPAPTASQGSSATRTEQLLTDLPAAHTLLRSEVVADRESSAWSPCSVSVCAFVCAVSALHVDLESQLDFGGRHAAPDAPVLGRTLPQQNLDLIGGNAERLQVPDDCLVQGLLGPERTAGEQVDVDEGVSLAIVWKAVRLVDDESNRLVTLGGS